MPVATVTIYATRYHPLTDAAISDTSATVHAHHVVYPRNIPVESAPLIAGDGTRDGYRWLVDISDGQVAKQMLYTGLVGIADEHRAEVNVSVEGQSVSLSYTYGDRMVG